MFHFSKTCHNMIKKSHGWNNNWMIFSSNQALTLLKNFSKQQLAFRWTSLPPAYSNKLLARISRLRSAENAITTTECWNYVGGVLNLIPARRDSWPCRSANSNYANYMHTRCNNNDNGVCVTGTRRVSICGCRWFHSAVIPETRSRACWQISVCRALPALISRQIYFGYLVQRWWDYCGLQDCWLCHTEGIRL